MHDIHMLNGRMFDDKDGNFTCVANDGHSTVDYVLASSDNFHIISSFGVDFIDFSDHCPLYCTLYCHDNVNHMRTEENDMST